MGATDRGSILEDLYAGAMDSSRWHRAIGRIIDHLRASGAALFAFDPLKSIILRDENYRVPVESLALYRDWISDDPRTDLMVPVPVFEPRAEPDLMPMRTWRRTPIFNELLREVDCPFFLCTWLHKSPSRMVALSFQGSLRRGPFEAQDRRHLKPLLPHIAQALEIRDRLEHQEIRANALAQGLQRTSFGLIVLDDAGRVLEANDCAARLMALNQGLDLRAASERFGVSLNTVRTQLKSIFSKTNVRSQTELVRKIMQVGAAMDR